MNAARRKELGKATALIEEAKSIIEAARDEEQEFFDNMPEGLQGGDKGQAAETAIDSLTEAFDALETVTEQIAEATT